MEKKKALIAMSGGVDSSVAAAMMAEEGYACIGCTMKLYQGQDDGPAGSGTCCSLDDTEDARAVAFRLGMPYYVFNFSDEFEEKVIDKFVRVYEAGGTPNPCIDCNRFLKFERLYRRALELGCAVMVTGHYARTSYDEESGRWQLLRALNREKDQSYVLYSMTQEQLSHTCFPLGSVPDKEQVRSMAQKYGFRNAQKPDSQDICFVRNQSYADFIRERTGREYPPGDFVDEQGNVLGRHRGLIRYTTGQRKGLGLALPQPMFVKRKNMQKNQVILTRSEGLFSRRLIAEDFNWIWTRNWAQIAGVSPEAAGPGHGAEAAAPSEGTVLEVTAKPRYRSKEAPALVRVLGGGKVEITFHEPQRALTIGQAVVLYDGENVVGGGTITEVPAEQ